MNNHTFFQMVVFIDIVLKIVVELRNGYTNSKEQHQLKLVWVKTMPQDSFFCWSECHDTHIF